MQIFGEHDPATIKQLETCVAAEEGARGVLCADGHLGYSQPIGGVVAYREHISPSGVGYDIGCGNKAVLTNIRLEDFDDGFTLSRVADMIFSEISFGVGRKNNEPVDHPIIDEIREAQFAPQRQLLDLAAQQLGTVGAGNHYVDVFADEQDQIWVGVHFGSRGFGHKTASGFLALAQGRRFDERASEGEMMSPPVLFDFSTHSNLAWCYVEAMELAGKYAYAGRDVVCDKVLEILGAKELDSVHNHHNYAWRENHGGTDYWVVRKGATPAFRGQRGFVGASMGGDSVILEGAGGLVADAALSSTIHGAGRAMSRSKAAGKWRKRWFNNVRDDDNGYDTEEAALAAPGATKARRQRVRVGGAVDFERVRADLQVRGIELRGGAADEAPAAYKSLPDVLAAHAGTVRVLHTLRPLIVCMAGADTYDPFKD